MFRRRHSPEQITVALRQTKIGTPIAELTQELGVHENRIHLWKKRFGELGTFEIRELQQLRDENTKLKRLVADLALDKTMLQDRPQAIRCDNGTEFTATAFDQWAHVNAVTIDDSRPGKPTDNAFIESFNGRVRQELLNASYFDTSTRRRLLRDSGAAITTSNASTDRWATKPRKPLPHWP